MDSIMKTFLCTNQEHARAAGDWLIAFLETRGNEIYPEVRETLVPLGLAFSLLAVVLHLVWTEETQPERGAEGTAQAKDTLKCSLSPLSLQLQEFMKILWEARCTVQEGPFKDLLFKAMCLLADFRIPPVADTLLLQAESSSERYVRSLLAPPWPPNSNPTACLQWGDPGKQQVPFLPQKPELCEIGRSCLWGSRHRVPCCWRGERLASGEGGHQGSQRTGLTGERLFACRDVVRLWRSLGSSDLGSKVLSHLIWRLKMASIFRQWHLVPAQPLDPLKVCSSAGASLQLPTCFLT